MERNPIRKAISLRPWPNRRKPRSELFLRDMALIKCPECKREISDRAASCPQCGHPMLVAAPPIIPRSAPEQVPQVQNASIKKRSSTFGGGCLIQLVGVVCLLLAVVTAPTIIGLVIFGVLGVALLIYGSGLANWFECSACGSKISNMKVSVCPSCRSRFS
jgi:DNA-directed RNA polymerase subunit RPC12/RpoP